MKAYLDAPRMTCAACGSILLTGRPRPGEQFNYVQVECLNKSCPNHARRFAYRQTEVELHELPEPVVPVQ